MPDVDIDFFDRDGVLKLFKHTPATMIKGDKTEKHKSGVYFSCCTRTSSYRTQFIRL